MAFRQMVMMFAAVAMLVGCPESGPDGADNSMASNNATENSNTSSNNGTTDGTNQATNLATNNIASGPYVDVVVEVIPLEWGLFAEPVSGAFIADASNRGDFASAEIEIGAGAFALRVSVDGSVVIDITGTTADRLVPVTGDVTAQPFFSPSPFVAQVEVRQTNGTWGAAIRPRADQPSRAVDEPGPLTDAGPWFETAFEAVAPAADVGGAVVELMHGIRERGGPIHTPNGVLFIAPAQDGEAAPQIRGTWNNYAADPASELHRITPGFWARYIQLPPGRHEYKLYYPSGDAWVTDISNPHIAWDGFDPNTVGSFNSVIRPDGARMVWLPQTHSPELGNTREAYVYLPASYDADAMKRYPVLYVHDGNESIVRGQFHIVAQQTAQANSDTEAILVFLALPSQNVRIEEYTLGTDGSLGNLYAEFVAQTLVPQIDGGFRTRTERTARGINGASLGGLISFWVGMQYPDVFGYVAGMSSSFFWGDSFIINEIAQRGCQNVAYYLDSGSPNDNFDVTQTMRDTLSGLGCDYDYVLEPNGQHDWAYWRGRFGGVLTDFASTHGG